MSPVRVSAAAKINLHLGVGAVRPDGFHPLDTVYQAISLHDEVTVEHAADWSLTVTAADHVDLAEVPLDESNLVAQAARLLGGRGAAVALRKRIPAAGGMAGGSADAAAALVALDRLWELQTPARQAGRARRRAGQRRPLRARRRHRTRLRPGRGRRTGRRPRLVVVGGGPVLGRTLDAGGLPPVRRARPGRRRPHAQ